MPSAILEVPKTPVPVKDPAADARVRSAQQRERDEALVRAAFDPKRLTWRNVSPVILVWMVLMHVGAVVAPFYFSWSAVIATVVLHWLTCSFGICLAFHRYLSHRSLKLRNPVEFFTVLCGVIAGEGPPLKWAAVHRLHHHRSDQEGDPHSPNQGVFWSHLLWMFLKQTPEQEDALYRRYIPELSQRPVLRMFTKYYAAWLWGAGLVLMGIGYGVGYAAAGTVAGASYMAASWVLWAMCARMTFAYHSTWFVNSATHLWGYRNYETRDMSRNLWWVAILAYGEGWHNNHHAHPSVAPAGHRWWELDPTWWAIRLFKAVGQAHDVKDRIPESTSRDAGTDENTPVSDTLNGAETRSESVHAA